MSYAANFGGLLRMLGSSNKDGLTYLKQQKENNNEISPFIEIMTKNFKRVGKAFD